jgi:hypothetical protein
VFEPRVFIDLGLPRSIGHTSLRLSVGSSYPRAVTTSVGAAEFTLTDLRLEPCVDAWSHGPLRLDTCAILEGGVLTGQGTNANGARTESRGLFELGLGLRPSWAVTPQVLVGLLVGGALPLLHYRFYFSTPDTTAYRLESGSGLVELSVALRFL